MSLLAEQPIVASVSAAPRAERAEDACDRATRDIDAFKQQIANLKHLQEQFCAQILAESDDSLSYATRRVLLHMFLTETRGQRDVGVMARRLKIDRQVLQGHLDRLQASRLAESERENHRLGHLYWALTERGRQHILDHQLAASQAKTRWGLARARKLLVAVLKWRSADAANVS
jgi:DNA-binding MarR family transcriptional regulator